MDEIQSPPSVEVPATENTIAEIAQPEITAQISEVNTQIESPAEVIAPRETASTPEMSVAAVAEIQSEVPVVESAPQVTDIAQEAAPATVESISIQVSEAPASAVAEAAPESAVPEAVVETQVPEVSAPTTENVAAETSSAPIETTIETIVEVPHPVEATFIEAPATTILTESSQTVQVVEVTPVVQPAPVVEEEAKPEIREVQSQLSELKSAEDAGATTFVPAQTVVDYYLGFIFRNTGFCARSGLEFVQDLEQIPVDVLQTHMRGGDFEKWFKDVLSDANSAEAIRSIREAGTQGEKLRTQILAVIGPKYKR